MTLLATIKAAGQRYDDAIARRNTAWARMQDARDALDWVRSRATIGAYNAAQHDYEHAERDLVRARVWFRAERLVAA